MTKKYALLSVSDKTNLIPLAKAFVQNGVEILSTGGTAKALVEADVPVTYVSDYTGHPEILGGRVKTLHPKVHGGILARRALEEDLSALRECGIAEIDYVVVNLYPFIQKLEEIGFEAALQQEAELIEFIDIGGPTLLRASAKNFKDVVVVTEPEDYEALHEHLAGAKELSIAERRKLAVKVFSKTSRYDASIAKYLSDLDSEDSGVLGDSLSLNLERVQALRYGENPHQVAGYYRMSGPLNRPWSQLQGKELSYNNLLDMSATIELMLDLMQVSDKSKAVIVKHLNPCGVAYGGSPTEAFSKARSCDSISAFGGIVCIDGEVDQDCAETMMEGFLEVVVASSYTDSAKEVFSRKKNTRVIQCSFDSIVFEKLQVRNIFDGILLQTRDNRVIKLADAELVAGNALTNEELESAELAKVVCKHVKSNAIVVAKDGMAIGIGAGQMSRIDSSRLALERAKKFGFDVNGSVAASDAFLPFPDTLEELAASGVTALIQPGGSIKDKEVIEAANKRNMRMLFTGTRHFKH